MAPPPGRGHGYPWTASNRLPSSSNAAFAKYLRTSSTDQGSFSSFLRTSSTNWSTPANFPLKDVPLLSKNSDLLRTIETSFVAACHSYAIATCLEVLPPVVKVQSSDRNEIGTRYLQSQLLFEFPDGAVNKGIAIVVVLTPNVTSGPQYDLIVKRITARLFAPSKTQHIPISVPYDNDRKRLNSRFVVLDLISTSKLRFVDLTEKPIRSVVGNEVIVGKRLGHQVLGI